MDPTRLTLGERIAGAGGLVLLICLFFPWYGAELDVGGSSASDSGTGWEVLSVIDILLFLIALVTIGIVAAKAAGSLPPTLPAPPAQILLGVGALALLLVLFRIIDLPTPGDLPDEVDVSRKIGVFVGLIAAGAIAYGGYSGQSERTV